ncbi:MAG: hypothetical protein AB7K24_28545 [Gemmataceae bacterium]
MHLSRECVVEAVRYRERRRFTDCKFDLSSHYFIFWAVRGQEENGALQKSVLRAV